MIKLPNNCRIGNISVFPQNREKAKADINLERRINYRFFDDASGKRKQIKKMGMNGLHSKFVVSVPAYIFINNKGSHQKTCELPVHNPIALS